MVKIKANFAISILFELALPLRYCHSLYYAWKVRMCEQKKDTVGSRDYDSKLRAEQKDVALLNVIKSFLVSAPQLTTQLIIHLTVDRPMAISMIFKIVGGCVMLFSLGWSMMKYHHAIQSANCDKEVVSKWGRFFLFLWHFGTIAAPILLISIAASYWLTYTCLALTVIWIGWTVWISTEDGPAAFFRNAPDHSLFGVNVQNIRILLFSAILGVVYIFTIVILHSGPTRTRYMTYYMLHALENGIVFVLFWSLSSSPTYMSIKQVWFAQCLSILALILFIIGIVAMLIYYFFYHPTMRKIFI